MSLHIQGTYYGTRSDADTASELQGERDVREFQRVESWLARTLDAADFSEFATFYSATIREAKKVTTPDRMGMLYHHLLVAAGSCWMEEITRRDDAEIDAIHDNEAAA